MKKALHIVVFVLILAFLLFLIPPVNQFLKDQFLKTDITGDTVFFFPSGTESETIRTTSTLDSSFPAFDTGTSEGEFFIGESIPTFGVALDDVSLTAVEDGSEVVGFSPGGTLISAEDVGGAEIVYGENPGFYFPGGVADAEGGCFVAISGGVVGGGDGGGVVSSDIPVIVVDPPPEELCPPPRFIPLFDSGAADPFGIPTHWSKDGPHFRMGGFSGDTNQQARSIYTEMKQPFKSTWLGDHADGGLADDGGSDAEEPYDWDGLDFNRSNKEELYITVNNISGIGVLIVVRYEKVGHHKYNYAMVEAREAFTGEEKVIVNAHQTPGSRGLLEGEGWLRIIYIAVDPVGNLFDVEDIRKFWDGFHSSLMQLTNLPATDPTDPTIWNGEIEDVWFGQDCDGRWGFFPPPSIPPPCEKEAPPVTISNVPTTGGTNITVYCSPTQNVICDQGGNLGGSAGTFGSAPTPTGMTLPTIDNRPRAEILADLLNTFLLNPNRLDPKTRLELLFAALVILFGAL